LRQAQRRPRVDDSAALSKALLPHNLPIIPSIEM
jgi:hypothetical protein